MITEEQAKEAMAAAKQYCSVDELIEDIGSEEVKQAYHRLGVKTCLGRIEKKLDSLIAMMEKGSSNDVGGV